MKAHTILITYNNDSRLVDLFYPYNDTKLMVLNKKIYSSSIIY